MKEIISSIGVDQIVFTVAAIIGVTKGITNKFNIQDSKNRELITIVVSLCGFIYLLIPDNKIVMLIGLFIVLYFGASGIYSFVPQSVKNQEQDAPVFESVDMSNEE